MSHQALILAGGRATRMGGADKGLVALSGRPLLAHALSALSAQLPAPARVWISANRNLEVYAGFGCPLLQDPLPDFPGPLAGVLAALQRDDGAVWLVMPCDAVRLPADFSRRLLAALADGRQAASARDRDGWHPSLLALAPGLSAGLAAYLAGGGRSIRGWLAGLDHVEVEFDYAFPNLNTPDALAALQAQPRAD
ncbi:molybdenum cofactor guanylyltransferase MobA [Chromobacterium sp.]|uniref:molybdenum cofactor guanylyltransferase MobA n=1 Tax=Chromobacterium sp. TaxID=306190 RepID=UPI0035B3323F